MDRFRFVTQGGTVTVSERWGDGWRVVDHVPVSGFDSAAWVAEFLAWDALDLRSVRVGASWAGGE